MSKILTITETSSCDEEACRGSVSIVVAADGKTLHSLGFHDGEPEDNSLGRGFSDVLSITSVLATVAKYVQQGYTVEFVEGDSSDND